MERIVVLFVEMPKTAKNKSGKARGWVITINNIVDWDGLQERVKQRKQVRYFCGQLEVGEHSSIRHLQGYVEFTGPVGLTAVRKLFPRCHAEVRRGTPQEARSYCSKEETRVEGSFFEHGELPAEQSKKQGTREDLVQIRELIQGGGGVREVLERFPVSYARYPKYVDKCLMLYSGRRNWKTEVRVYVGPTDCGKTSSAYEEFPDIWPAPGGDWFDGYDGEPHVLIDDFNGLGRDNRGIDFRQLLRLLDRYRMVVPVKGSFVNWRPKVIIITTNYSPELWYPCEDPAPLLRRIDVIKRWNKN